MPVVDDDIRADFLAEAGDLVDRLGGQLIELESRPTDAGLLNSIFRVFHTVKGGAGFLAIAPLVELCHVTEDVFNAIRNGRRGVDAVLMDVVLEVVDQVQAMLMSIAAEIEPKAAPRELIGTLHALLREETQVRSASPASGNGTLSEEEFEALLDPPPSKTKVSLAAPELESTVSETIGDDEFDALLDQLAAAKKLEPPKSGSACPSVANGTAGSPRAGEGDPKTPVATTAPSVPPVETTVRVETSKLDCLMNLVGELVLVRNRLKALATGSSGEIARTVRELDFITRGLQGSVMQVRMQPIGKVFSRFPKLARDVARGLGKQVEVTLIGQDTGLDKNLVEALADPLVHMVRNSVDHGIEMPQVRTARGKPAAGQLRLEAWQEGDHIRITVRDDGAGIDPERIRSKVIESRLMDAAAAARLNADECLQLIFLPGLSTKEQVSDLSGRGVGMDVVKSRILSLKGTVRIESQPGWGSAVHLRVPLTLAILPALMVDAGTRQFALPLAMVAEVFALDPARVRRIGCWDVVPHGKESLRLIDLEVWAGAADTKANRHVVVVMLGEERFGLIVRQVQGREEVVIKPLGASLRGLAGVSGATVTPQGRVALIVDIPSLVQAHAKT
ncbi:MAG: chemotaxis protein CheA [Panacagrimonas sp.]